MVTGPKLATLHFLDMYRGALHILLAGLAEIGCITSIHHPVVSIGPQEFHR